ncbi:hypothetical protein FB45DRAFT_82585 [Roridomyces roridus]|uniref:DUF6534 domain-containing protein n=1 Tax=Roridomyces roridus TaxID=1738132 RepID=A0AAD7BL31_9AGAR|nr:hypothetical protein FB45DRAFT_82585 [Roridomyces roridus]
MVITRSAASQFGYRNHYVIPGILFLLLPFPRRSRLPHSTWAHPASPFVLPAMALSSLVPETLENTLGAFFFGVIFSCILFGVSSLQVYLYFHHYPNDGLLYKSSVGILWILDALHISLIIYSSYYYGVLGFGDAQRLIVVIWPIKLTTALNVVVVLLVQSMYTYRLWLLSGYHHGALRYVVTAIVLGGFGIGIVLAYESYGLQTFTDIEGISWALEGSFSASTAIDVLISVAMCFYLRKSKSTTGQRSGSAGSEHQLALNSRISGLIQYTLSCGIFTSACSLACLFTFVLMPNNLIFLALTFILTRLYVNSYVAMMNARRRQGRAPGSTGGVGVSFALETRGQTQTHGAELWGGPATVTFARGLEGDLEAQPTPLPFEKKALGALDWGQDQDDQLELPYRYDQKQQHQYGEPSDAGIQRPAYARQW